MLAIEAWKRAFAGVADARLVFKSRWGLGYAAGDPRIQVITSNETTRGIQRYYFEADALLAVGNEGFGLPLVEGMATGLPAIALDSEGQHDTCVAAGPDRVFAVPPSRWEVADDTVYGEAGVRGVPSLDDLVDRLRWVADHRDAAARMGEAASEWACASRNIWQKPLALLTAMGYLDQQLEVTPLLGQPLRPGELSRAADPGATPTSSLPVFISTSEGRQEVDASLGDSRRPIVFLSWSSPEGLAIAEQLKTILEPRLPEEATVFVSSTIKPGGDPLQAILHDHLLQASVLIVIMTNDATLSHWVTWEAAAAWARRSMVIPLFVGIQPKDVPGPLALLCQGGDIADIGFLNGAITEVIAHIGRGTVRELTALENRELQRAVSGAINAKA